MKTNAKNILYDGKWQFRVDDITLDNGHQMELAIVDHPGAVVIVPMQGDSVLMLEQFRPVMGKTILELPAGTLDPGEKLLVAAQRELREETGYQAGELVLLSQVLPAPGMSNEQLSIFLAMNLSWAPLPQDEDEQIVVKPMPLTELVEDALLGRLEDAKSVVGILQANHFFHNRED